jgi:alkylation response protein AidB-like acyl-CoA dehydrogenase
MLYNSPYVTIPAGTLRGGAGGASMLAIARNAGRLDDPTIRDLVGEARTLEVVGRELQRRLGEGIRGGEMPNQSSAIGLLFNGISAARRMTIAFEIAGAAGAAWTDDDGDLADRGTDFLVRQATCIGGGTTEMARNVIAERVLGMPRDRALDRDVAFRDVPRSRPAKA